MSARVINSLGRRGVVEIAQTAPFAVEVRVTAFGVRPTTIPHRQRQVVDSWC